MSEIDAFGMTPEPGSEAAAPPEQPAPAPEPQQAQDDAQTKQPAPEPEPAPPPEPEPPAPEEGTEEDGLSEDGNGFRIGNKVYKDILAADHAFRQATGRASAESRRANSLSRERDELLQRIAVLEAQTSSPTPQNATDAPPADEPAPAQERKRLTERLNRDQLNELIAEDGADAAIAKVMETVEEWATETLDARTAPLRQQEEVAQAQQVAMESFQHVAEQEADGQPLFPELRDETLAPEIVATWDQLVMEDPDFRAIALSPAGAKMAYTVWRVNRGGQPSQPASDPQPAPQPAPGPTASATRDASLQQMGSGQRAPSVTPGSAPAPAHSEEAVRQLIAAKQHPLFGVQLER